MPVPTMPTMPSNALALALIAASLGCTHKSAPTREWCDDFVSAFRQRDKLYAPDLAEPTMVRTAVDQLRDITSFSGLDLAEKACSDAFGDSPERAQARAERIIGLVADVRTFMNQHLLWSDDHAPPLGSGDAAELQRRIDAIADELIAH
jgi:hypothetical protein